MFRGGIDVQLKMLTAATEALLLVCCYTFATHLVVFYFQLFCVGDWPILRSKIAPRVPLFAVIRHLLLSAA